MRSILYLLPVVFTNKTINRQDNRNPGWVLNYDKNPLDSRESREDYLGLDPDAEQLWKTLWAVTMMVYSALGTAES